MAFCTIPDYPLYIGTTHFAGIEENDESTAFATFHPNPTSGTITLSGENLHRAEVVNVLGQQVLSVQGEGNELRIDMAALPAGVYFVNVTDEEGRRCVRKVVRELPTMKKGQKHLLFSADATTENSALSCRPLSDK